MPKTPKSDIERQLETARAVQDAQAWRPEVGEYITGILVAIKRGVSKWGAYPLAIFQMDDGSYLAFHAFHGVPKSRLIEANPAIGDTLTIQYDGKVPAKREGEDEMNMYTIVVHGKAAGEVPWSSFA